MSARVSADYVIVGSGIAGLRAAIALAPRGKVVILTKSDPAAGSTGYAQGGIAAAVGPDDSPELHAADTLAAGDGLADEAAVRVLVEEGPEGVRELMAWGAAFDRDADGSLALAREGAHGVRRVLHARDATGREIGRALARHLASVGEVTVIDHALATSAIVEAGQVVGVNYLDRDGQPASVRARATLLATGGAGQVFRETTNPDVATGDGIALAYLAGARVADLEFVQFHPTALAVDGAPRYLLSEALRGEGGTLVNRIGEPFMSRYDPAADLAPRDRVARAIVLESKRTGGPIFLTMTHLPAAHVRERFPLITELCRRAGLDLGTDPIPVGPAAHYMMGGVVTDLDARTSLPGLFAAGEVACTGVHGANRLASNSLLEGLVFGARAGAAMSEGVRSLFHSFGHFGDRARPASPGSWTAAPPIDRQTLRNLMWNEAAIFRDRAGLERALSVLTPQADAAEERLRRGEQLDADAHELANLVVVARLIVRAALRREESRGAHSRTDFPERDDLHWKLHCTDTRWTEARPH